MHRQDSRSPANGEVFPAGRICKNKKLAPNGTKEKFVKPTRVSSGLLFKLAFKLKIRPANPFNRNQRLLCRNPAWNLLRTDC